ncbi:MAG: hypothetical protein WCO56_17665 [Verrucomicrobiota bacterium]
MNKIIRSVLTTLLAVPLVALQVAEAAASSQRIDRHALVTRHNLEWNDPAGQIPLGNGEFCFNADGTGLQTFGGNSMSHWGWHSFPLPAGWTADQVPPTGTFQQGRNVGGDVFPKNAAAIRTWMFDNPHAINLGRLRLCKADGAELTVTEISGLARTLDLWSGVQTSTYQVNGEPVRVETCVHPSLDAMAVRIESPLLVRCGLEVAVDFPYPNLRNGAWVGDFARDDAHTTKVIRNAGNRASFQRQVDSVQYGAALAWSSGAVLIEPSGNVTVAPLEIRKAEYGAGDRWADVTAKVAGAAKDGRLALTVNFQSMAADPAPGKAKSLRVVYALAGKEQKIVVPDNQMLQLSGGSGRHLYRLQAQGTNKLEFVCAFAHTNLVSELPSFTDSRRACVARWETFWKTGGAVDLSASKDPRWRELERRIVLSQYLMAAQSAGSYPSAETGLMGLDPWRSQFHMEMVWWHLAHYALWDRWDMADQALGCYQRFAPAARALAAQLGYQGLKWAKSVGPEGRSAPWGGNQVLLWKQPHPIFFAELEYRLRPTRATLEKWADIVNGTAVHMADYPTRDATNGVYSLVPAMPPSEQGITRDTVFDLAYWRWGLDAAQRWRERLGQARVPQWDEVRRHLAPLPIVDGVFVHSAEWHDTYTKRAWEHPDPVGVLGMLPPVVGVDAETAHRTVLKVWETWNWNRTWGWDCPWMAMAAARVGEPQIALEALLKDSARNQFDQRGVNTGGPCPYLPGNGGLLYAVAMMAAGWDGAPKRHAPGFPDDGNWVVNWEGLKTAP